MQSRGHWSTVRSWRRTNWWGIFGIKHQIQRCWKIIFLLILLSLGIKPFKGQYFCAGQWPWSQQSHSGLIQHSFFIKYCSHIFINCVYWFDRTTAEAWENGTDCKCFYPMANVSRKPQFDLIIRRLNLSPFQEVFMWWCSVTMFIIPTLLIILIWGVMAHHFATENETRLGEENQSEWTERWNYHYFHSFQLLEIGYNQDGSPGRALPPDHWSLLSGLPRGHHLAPDIEHHVVGQDLALVPAQRDAQPCHLHRHDLHHPGGVRQQDLLQEIQSFTVDENRILNVCWGWGNVGM